MVSFTSSISSAPEDSRPSPNQVTAYSRPFRNQSYDSRSLAYVFYLTESHQETLLCPLKVQITALRKTNPRSNIDIVVMTNGKRNRNAYKDRIFENITFVKIPQPKTRGLYQWGDSFSKLYFSHLTQYDRVVYLELDCLVLKNLDHLFDISPFPSTIAAPRAYWLPQPFFQSGGPLVIDPSDSTKKKFDEILSTPKSGYAGDMDWMNEQFKDSAVLLDGFYALLVGEWIKGDGIQGFFGKKFSKTPREIMDMAVSVHFIANNKPWGTTLDSLRKDKAGSDEELFLMYEKWYKLKDEIC